MSDTPNFPQNTVVTALTVAGTNEVQTITVKAKKGTFKISFDGETTAALAYNAEAATVQTALLALSNIPAGGVAVTGGPGDELGTKPYSLTFGGALAADDVPEVTTDVSGLEEGTKTAAVATKTGGVEVTDNPDALQRGTGLADRTEETSPLDEESASEHRAENSGDYN